MGQHGIAGRPRQSRVEADIDRAHHGRDVGLPLGRPMQGEIAERVMRVARRGLGGVQRRGRVARATFCCAAIQSSDVYHRMIA